MQQYLCCYSSKSMVLLCFFQPMKTIMFREWMDWSCVCTLFFLLLVFMVFAQVALSFCRSDYITIFGFLFKFQAFPFMCKFKLCLKSGGWERTEWAFNMSIAKEEWIHYVSFCGAWVHSVVPLTFNTRHLRMYQRCSYFPLWHYCKYNY